MSREIDNGTHPGTPVANGSRVAIALGCWLLSGLGLLMSLMLFVGESIVSPLTQPLADTLGGGRFYVGLGVAYAWLALGIMTGGWVSDRRVHWHWPLVGGLVGILCAGVFATVIPLFLPCALLGLYLCWFHLVEAP